MRIERVNIENLNSLLGRFDIDLTDRAYSGGLFAIVGPSGAGKTTVLDAICLALYGKTPRIETISETQDELMTKSASVCKAEVVFSARGKRYKSIFVHERSRGSKPFRAVRRELLEQGADGAWQVIAARIREVDEKIEAICGLDYGRFTRSIMLAQFRFAEFLQASSNDRAAILEQITDMDIYRRISIAVYERTKQQRELLSNIRVSMDGIQILSEAEEAVRKKEMGLLAAAISDHEKLKELLNHCRLAAKQVGKLGENIARYRQAVKPLEEAFAAKSLAFAAAEQTEKTQAQELFALQDTLKAVRELDIKAKAKAEDVARIDKDIAEETLRIKEHKNKILDIFRKYEPGASNERYRQMYESCELSAQLRARAKAELDAVKAEADSVRKNIAQLLSNKDEAHWQSRLDALKKALPLCEARDVMTKAQAELNTYQRRQQELKKEQDSFEATAKEIEDKFTYAQLELRFGKARSELADGQPCPLCGALHHPKAETSIDESDFITAKKAYDEMIRQRDELKQRIVENSTRMADTAKLIEDKRRFIEENNAVLTAGEQETDTVLQAISGMERMLRDYHSLRNKLDKVNEQVTALTVRFGDVDKDVEAIDSRKQMIGEIQNSIGKRQQDKAQVQTHYDALIAQRRSLFGDKNADAEEESANRRFGEAQAAKEKCRLDLNSAERELEQNRTNMKSTQTAIEEQARQLDMAYKKALADAAAVHNVSADDDMASLYAGYTDAAARLENTPDEKTLGDAAEALQRFITGETRHHAVIGQILKTNESERLKRKSLENQERAYKKTLEKWEKLNALIGSSSGDKFSRMAQSITFDALLRYANQSLMRMSDRYILQRDGAGAAKPLELAVIDTYQAGEKRPVSNLSGGESFIVSLALALGLSEMSSGAARIDSLFIDEGFASLDEDYLEAALQTLSTLGSREGKLIGVISHVEALKSRIDVQIEVSRRSGGCAALSGPGIVSIHN